MRGQLGRQVTGYSILALLIMLGGLADWKSLQAFEQQEAVKRAARRYRMQVFETFRADRLEYDRRVRIGNQILQQWESRGEPKDQAERLVDWFSQASKATEDGLELPVSRDDELTMEDQIESAAGNVGRTPVETPAETLGTDPVERSIETPAERLGTDPAKQSVETAAETLVTDPLKQSIETPKDRPVPKTTQTPRRQSRRPANLATPLNSLPPLKFDSNRGGKPQFESHDVPRQTPEVSALEPRMPRDGGSLIRKTDQPLPHTSLTDETRNLLKRREHPLKESSRQSQLSKQTGKEFSVLGPSPSVQDLVASSVDVPESLFEALSETRADPFSSAEHDPIPSARMVVTSLSQESPVDLTVLASRIRASNLRLAEIESELATNGLWDLERLRPLVEQFEAMLAARQLSRLYYEALNELDRQRVAPFSSVDATVSMLTKRLFEARAVATEDPVFFPVDSREFSELQKLTQTVESWNRYLQEEKH